MQQICINFKHKPGAASVLVLTLCTNHFLKSLVLRLAKGDTLYLYALVLAKPQSVRDFDVPPRFAAPILFP